MHGCNLGSILLVNAEVDSMGGVVDGGAGIGVKTSPHRAAIENTQAALRQKYDIREEKRRELEFLENGGNPLDFKFGNATCISVQSTSLTGQHPEQFVTSCFDSEAKESFALTASPRGDSGESSGRLGSRTVCEPNSADNLLLFDGENELLVQNKNSIHHGKRNNIVPSKQSSQMGGSRNGRKSEDLTIFRPYARRNRSKSTRDVSRSNSTEIAESRGGHGSLVSRGGSRDPKGTVCAIKKQKDQKAPSFSNPKPESSNGDIVSKIVTSDKQSDMKLEGIHGISISTCLAEDSLPENKLDVGTLKGVTDNQLTQPTQVDDQQPHVDADGERHDFTDVKEPIRSAAIDGLPCAATTVSGNEAGYGPENRPSNLKRDRKSIPNEVQNTNSAAVGMKGLDSESSCTLTSICLGVNSDSNVCTNKTIVGSNESSTEQKVKLEGSPDLVGEILEGTNETRTVGNGSIVKVEEEIHLRVPGEQNQVKYTSNIVPGNNSQSVLENNNGGGSVLGDSNDSIVNKENSSAGRSQSLAPDLHVTTLSEKDSTYVSDYQNSENSLKLANKAREDLVLEEARIIEAKRQRIAELSVGTLSLENCHRSHWGFVLEEMAWLANDFAQERLWKITAAAQMSRVVASASRLRFEEENQHWKLKKVAHTLANAVMQFWHSAEMHLNSDISSVALENSKSDLIVSSCASLNETSEDKIEKPITKTNKALEYSLGRSLPLAVQGYAVRLLKSTSSPVPPFQAETVPTPEDITAVGISDMSWEDHLTEEILFYSVPSGAMETYRKSIESHLVQSENTCSSMQEEVDTHMYDAIAEYGYKESTYDDDEGETSTYYLSGAFGSSRPSKFVQKKQKNVMRSHSARSYETTTDVPMGKRPSTNLNVGAIPTKRMRTAPRQRFVSPFGTGGVHVPDKTDASSGDTSSFQDDHYTLHGESQMQKSVEVESATDFEKQMRYDYAETSTKPKKKKKKPKHLGTTYDQGWQLDSAINRNQRNDFKKRTESRHFDSNGTTGLYGQHIAKRPKIMNHSLDNAFDNIAPMNGSIPSSAASVSNMSNPNKFIRLMGGRDRGKKVKGLKISAGQHGSGSQWTLFEDQALVVLVHDMGPNWELVSDAINTTLQFKCIFRKPKECKDHHKTLMDRSASDGVDSAEDLGSSQSYPSSLPGIPKGSARQLFQCLQGPMVEDTLKSHFEKIISIEQKQHYRRIQNDNHDAKQIAPVHNSHVIALSQAFPNNRSGSVLTPLDLCDSTPSSPDLLALGYQASNQGAAAPTLPTGPNSSLQGTPGIALGSNSQSLTGQVSASMRDGRFGVPRTPKPDEHQRMQQHNQPLPGRNAQQSSMSVPGALSGSDRGVRVNGLSTMSGMSRPLPMARPGFQGMTSSSSPMGGTPSSAIHSGSVTGPGNSMSRPRDTSHILRPGYNSEHQRPGTVPELPMQTSQGSVQGLAPFNGFGTTFSNPATTPPLQTYAGHTQQQQAYAMRVAKERQKQRYLQQQQRPQQLAASNSSQSQTQHPIPSSSPIAQTASVPPLIASPLQQKHQLQSGNVQNLKNSSGGLTHHLQRQQHAQAQQQAKALEGIGRGNTVNQNLPVEPSQPNGIISQSMQSKSPHGSGLNSVPVSKPQVPSQSPNQSPVQQKHNSTQTPKKPLHPIPAPSDSKEQVQVPQLASSNTLSAPRQPVAPAGVASNPSQPIIQRVLQQNCQRGKAPADQAQDQQSANKATQIGTVSVTPQTCTDSANAVSAVSSLLTSQLKASELDPDCDSGMQSTSTTQVARIGSDPTPTVSQGSGQKQLSGSVSSHEPQSQHSLVTSPHSTQHHNQQSPVLQKEQQQELQSSPSHLSQPSQQQTQHLEPG